MIRAVLRRRSVVLSSAQRVFALGALLLGSASCGVSLDDAYMAKDQGGANKATEFHSLGDEIHCIMRVSGGDEDTRMTLALHAPSKLELSQNELYPWPNSQVKGPVDLEIQLFQLDAKGAHVTMGPWPVGAYRMDIAIDGEGKEALDFSVVK